MDLRFTHRVRHLLLSYPDGLPIRLLKQTWKSYYNAPLVPSSLGYSSVYDLCVAATSAVALTLEGQDWIAKAILTANAAEELVEYVRSEILEADAGAAAESAQAGQRNGVMRHVSYERVQDWVQNRYLAGRTFESFGLQCPRNLTHLLYVDRRVSTAITAYCASRCVVTLWELEQYICQNEVVDSYEALRLGQLAYHPEVRRIMFPDAPAVRQPVQPSKQKDRRGPEQEADPPLMGPFPRITAYDVAVAVRHRLVSEGIDKCRRAAAGGVWSADGMMLVLDVLTSMALAAKVPVAVKGSIEFRVRTLGCRLGVLVNDLLLYVNIAEIAIQEEQVGALRGAAGAARTKTVTTAQRQQGLQITVEGAGARRPPLPLDNSAYWFPSSEPGFRKGGRELAASTQGQQAQEVRMSEKVKMALAALREEPGEDKEGGASPGLRPGVKLPPADILIRRHLRKSYGLAKDFGWQQLQGALQDIVREALSRPRKPRESVADYYESAARLVAAKFTAPLAQARAATASSELLGTLVRGGKKRISRFEQKLPEADRRVLEDTASKLATHQLFQMLLCAVHTALRCEMPVHAIQMAAFRREGKSDSAARNPDIENAEDVLELLKPMPHETILEDARLTSDVGIAKRHIAQEFGLQRDALGYSDLQAVFQKMLSDALGGARVQPSPADGFYSAVALMLSEQFFAVIREGQAMELRTLRKGVKEEVSKMKTKMKVRIDKQGGDLVMNKFFGMMLRVLHAAMRGVMPPLPKEAVSADAARASGDRKEATASGSSDEGKGESSSDSDDGPYIRNAEDRAVLRSTRCSKRLRGGKRGGGKGQSTAPAADAATAVQTVVAAFQQLVSALAAARPSAGWSVEALSRLRGSLLGPSAESGTANSAGGADGAAETVGACSKANEEHEGEGIFGVKKLIALSTFIGFMLQSGSTDQRKPPALAQPQPQPQQQAVAAGPSVRFIDAVAALRSAVLELRDGCSLLALAGLERLVAERLASQLQLRLQRPAPTQATSAGLPLAGEKGAEAPVLSVGSSSVAAGSFPLTIKAAGVFEAAGLGCSLLSALEAAGDGDLLVALTGDTQGPARAPLHQVLELVAAVLRSCRLAGTLTGDNTIAMANVTAASGGDGNGSGGGSGSNGSDGGAVAAIVSRALRAHYGVRRVECLGHGPVGRLLALASRSHATPPLGWHSAVALAPAQSSSFTSIVPLASGAAAEPVGATVSSAVGVLGGVGREAALAALRAAPDLSDLRLATQWDLIFETELGPLEDFLRAEGTAAGITVLELPVPPTGGPTLELSEGGRLIKLPYGATRADILARAVSADARGVAAALLSVVAAEGGVGGCPTTLISHHLSEALLDMARQAAGRSELTRDAVIAQERGTARVSGVVNGSADTSAAATAEVAAWGSNGEAEDLGVATACRFTLGVLPHLPLPLLAPLAEAVLLPALAMALNRYGAEPCGNNLGEMDLEGTGVPAAATIAASAMEVDSLGGAAVAGTVLHAFLLRQVAAVGPPHAVALARSCLHHLGFSLGVEAWQEDWRRLYRGDAGSCGADTGGDTLNGDVDKVGAAPDPSLTAAGIDATTAGISEGSEGIRLQGNDVRSEMDLDAEEETGPRPPLPLRENQERKQPAATPPVAQLHQEASSFPEIANLAAPLVPSGVAEEAGGSEAPSRAPRTLEVDAPMNPEECRHFVESIRRDEFGMGVELVGEAAALSGRLAARTGRALQRLAAELYSTDSHFVMELVQNADDNTYPAGVVPSLEFVLQRGAITAVNNELGFSPANLRALCDVGASTKARVTGYIGHKGIGFKSVFRVSAAPQVHSRNFHVAFDLARHGSLGYCLPDWCPLQPGSAAATALIRLGCADASVSPSDPGSTTFMTHGSHGGHEVQSLAAVTVAKDSFLYGTAIVLPLRQDMAGAGASADGGHCERGAVLRRRFADLSPTLLLFLQRLQRIVVRDEVATEPLAADGTQHPSPVGSSAIAATAAGAVRVLEMERRRVPGRPHLVRLTVRATACSTAAAAATYPAAAPAPMVGEIAATADLPGDGGGSVGHGRGSGGAATSSTTVTTWAVVTSAIQPQVSRAGVVVNETRVSLAFSLGPAHQQQEAAAVVDTTATATGGRQDSDHVALLAAPVWRGGRPPQQPVFAFLPLRSYGLRFVVQADWVVPSSREALDADSPWNQGLRAQLPGLFLRALAVFKGLPLPSEASAGGTSAAEAGGGASALGAAMSANPRQPHRPAELFWVDQWLRCIPLEGEAQGFFAGLPHSIATLLRAAPCIPTSDGGWATPGETAVCASGLVASELLELMGGLPPPQSSPSSPLTEGGASVGAQKREQQAGGAGGVSLTSVRSPLLSVLGLRMVAPEARALYESRPLRALLGVREFGPAQPLEVLRALVHRGGLERGEVGLPWLAHTLAALFAATAGGGHGHDHLHRLYPHQGAESSQYLTRGSLLRELRALPILPLQGGGWASIDQLRQQLVEEDREARRLQQQENETGSQGEGAQYGSISSARTSGAGVLFFPLPESEDIDDMVAEGNVGAGVGVSAAVERPGGGGGTIVAAAAAVALLRRCGLAPGDLYATTGQEAVSESDDETHLQRAYRQERQLQQQQHQQQHQQQQRRRRLPVLHFLDPRFLAAVGVDVYPAARQQGAGGGVVGKGAAAMLAGQQRRLAFRQGLEELGVSYLSPTDLVLRFAVPILTAADTCSCSCETFDGIFKNGNVIRYLAMPLLAGMLPQTSAAGDTVAGGAPTRMPQYDNATGMGFVPVACVGAAASAAVPQKSPASEFLLQALRRQCAVLTSAGPGYLVDGVLMLAREVSAASSPHQESCAYPTIEGRTGHQPRSQPDSSVGQHGAVAAAIDRESIPMTFTTAALRDAELAAAPGGGGGTLYLSPALLSAAVARGSGAAVPSLGDLLPLLPHGNRKQHAAEWPMLDAAYLELFPDLAAEWQWLFEQLGAQTFPRPVPRVLELGAADLEASPWASSVAARYKTPPEVAHVGARQQHQHQQQHQQQDAPAVERTPSSTPSAPLLVQDWSCPPLLRLLQQATEATTKEGIVSGGKSRGRGCGTPATVGRRRGDAQSSIAACGRLFELLATHWGLFASAMEAKLLSPLPDPSALPGPVMGCSGAIAAAVPAGAGTHDQSWAFLYPVSAPGRSSLHGGLQRPQTSALESGPHLGPSSLAAALRAVAWVPATLPDISCIGHSAVNGKSERGLLCPTETFAPLPHIQRLLRHHVPYVDVSILKDVGVSNGDGRSRKGLMLQQLGVVSELTHESVLGLLTSWSRGCASGARGNGVTQTGHTASGSSFTSSLTVMAGLYGFLEAQLQRQESAAAARAAATGGHLQGADGALDVRTAVADVGTGGDELSATMRVLGDGDGATEPDLIAAVVGAFAREPLIWLPDDPYVTVRGAGLGPQGAEACGSHSQSGIVPGHFYRCSEVVLRDPANVLDELQVASWQLDLPQFHADVPDADRLSEVRPPRLLPTHYQRQQQDHRHDQQQQQHQPPTLTAMHLAGSTTATAGAFFERLAQMSVASLPAANSPHTRSTPLATAPGGVECGAYGGASAAGRLPALHPEEGDKVGANVVTATATSAGISGGRVSKPASTSGIQVASAEYYDENAIELDLDDDEDASGPDCLAPERVSERPQAAVDAGTGSGVFGGDSPGMGSAGELLKPRGALIAAEPTSRVYLACLRQCAAAATATATAAATAITAQRRNDQLLKHYPSNACTLGATNSSFARETWDWPALAALRIFAHWGRQLSESKKLGPDEVDILARCLQREPLLPCISGRWRACGGPSAALLNDDPWVADALVGAAGLELVRLPTGDDGETTAAAAGAADSIPRAQQQRAQREALPAAGREGGGSAEGCTGKLMEALGVQLLSRCVSVSVCVEGPPEHDTVVERAVRQAVLAAESYLSYMLPDGHAFAAVQAAVEELLPAFRVSVVSSFTATLRIDTARGSAMMGGTMMGGAVRPSPAAAVAAVVAVSPPALMVGSELYVQRGAVTNFTAISRELTRLFRGGRPWPALAERLLSALLLAAAGGEVAQLLEHQGVPLLPFPQPPPGMPDESTPSSGPLADMSPRQHLLQSRQQPDGGTKHQRLDTGGAGPLASSIRVVRCRRWRLPPPVPPPPPPPTMHPQPPPPPPLPQSPVHDMLKDSSEDCEEMEQQCKRRKTSHSTAAAAAAAGDSVLTSDTTTKEQHQQVALRKRRRVHFEDVDVDGAKSDGPAATSGAGEGDHSQVTRGKRANRPGLEVQDGGGDDEDANCGGCSGFGGDAVAAAEMAVTAATAANEGDLEQPCQQIPPPQHVSDLQQQQQQQQLCSIQAYGGQDPIRCDTSMAVQAVTKKHIADRSAQDRIQNAERWWSVEGPRRAMQEELERRDGGSGFANPGAVQRRRIGRWGEELVYKHLVQQVEFQTQRQHQPPASKPCSQGAGARAGSVAFDRVVWLNRDKESFLPYDIYISHADESVTYIEVKTSASSSKDLFEFSLSELQFAEEQGNRYVVYRVLGGGGQNPTISRLSNPVQMLREKAATLLMVL